MVSYDILLIADIDGQTVQARLSKGHHPHTSGCRYILTGMVKNFHASVTGICSFGLEPLTYARALSIYGYARLVRYQHVR